VPFNTVVVAAPRHNNSSSLAIMKWGFATTDEHALALA
jgi:hypothetical protein